MDVCRSNGSTNFVDILDPFVVALESVGRKTDDFGVASRKVGCATSDFSEFSSADGSKVSGMREENSPAVSNPLVEFDRTLDYLG